MLKCRFLSLQSIWVLLWRKMRRELGSLENLHGEGWPKKIIYSVKLRLVLWNQRKIIMGLGETGKQWSILTANHLVCVILRENTGNQSSTVEEECWLTQKNILQWLSHMIFIKEFNLVVFCLFKIGVIAGEKYSGFKNISKIQCQNVLIPFFVLGRNGDAWIEVIAI